MAESRFRLRSSAFVRAEEVKQMEPKRAVFLSVEGDETERTYFENLRCFLEANASQAILHIEVLRHKHGDGYSDPEQVIELLNEYVELRSGDLLPELPETFTKRYPPERIRQYLDAPASFTKAERLALNNELFKIGIDLEYRRYLKSFCQEGDYFAIVIDRDCDSHSRELLEDCIQICLEKGYGCYITNPCFEFWLLLHLCDVKTEYAGKLDELLENKKRSNHHTYVSYEVSSRAHHRKKIGEKAFHDYYCNHISEAIARAKQFEQELEGILDRLGCNLPELFERIGYSRTSPEAEPAAPQSAPSAPR